jgi:response regulator RpfG family c-di-GMP phosphodiesterase
MKDKVGLNAKPSPGKILIVDDDVLTTATLTQILLQNGYQVFHAEDNALAAKLAIKSRPDMVICNAESTKVDAQQLVKFIHQAPQTRRTAILLLTGRREMLTGEPGILGPRQYLVKPFTREQVAISVQENLRHRQSEKK